MTQLAPRPAALTPAHARVLSAWQARYSPNTVRAYTAAWNAWQAWCDAHGVGALPADPAAVAEYLSERAEAHSMATVRMGAAAIAEAHREAGSPNPVATASVRGILRGLGRQAAQAGRSQQRQAGALTDDALRAIRQSACQPRTDALGRTESADRARLRGMVDVALAQVMSDGGLRRSEAAALVWADVERARDGSGRLTIRRSKTDTTGAGAVVAITARAMRDLQAIRGGAADDAPVFGLSPESICRRIKAAARAAGLGDRFSGHSGRVGMARRMTENGAPMQAVMIQGRWAGPGMVARYVRGESAGAALRYLRKG